MKPQCNSTQPQLTTLPFDILCNIFVYAQWPTLALVSRSFYQASRSMGVRARFYLVEFGRDRVLDGLLGLAARRPRALRQDVVLLLLALGADPRADGQWILRHACAHAWAPVVAKLVAMRHRTRSAAEARNSTGNPGRALDAWRGGGSAAPGASPLGALLVDVGQDNGAALRIAAASGHADIVRLLASSGADVHVQDDEPLARAASAGHAAAVQALLDCNADAAADESRALRLAVLPGDSNLVCVRLLLDAGAQPRAMGDSALLSAAYHGDGLRQPAQSAQRYRSRASAPAPAPPPGAATSHVALVRLLLARGADPDARGGRPLVFASSRGSPLTVAALAGAGADVHVQDDEPVRAAAERGHAEVLRLLLLRFGAHASALEESALQGAARGGHLPCVRLLLEAGADAAAEGGRRALVAAARAGWVDVVAELVAAGADPADPEFVACAARSAALRRTLGMPPPNCLLNSV